MNTTSTAAMRIVGNVHGGQQPVVGARIYLYDAGANGNGSAANNLLTIPVFSDGSGGFSITGNYACSSSTDQVYVAATGGNAGAGTNSSITLVAALGPCTTLHTNAASTYTTVNEVTTVAAAWALGAFATGPANVGASSTNILGITNAMTNASLLANATTGLAANTAGQTIETGKLYGLADALASCVNSKNGDNGCAKLFSAATPPGGAVPVDTFTAALNIVHYPANNVAAVFGTIGGTPPFATTLRSAPNDWTMSDTIALTTNPNQAPSPRQIAIDGNGSPWTIDIGDGLLFFLTSQGTLLNAAGYGQGSFGDLGGGVTVDAAGSVWVSSIDSPSTVNGGNGYLSKFQSTTGTVPGAMYMTGVGGTPYFYDANLTGPYLLASDSPTTAGNLATGNIVFSDFFGGNYTEVFSDAGATVNSTASGGGPQSAVFDASHGLWVPDFGANDIIHVVSGTGTSVSCCMTLGSVGLGLDAQGNVWLNSLDSNDKGYISEVSNANALLINSATTDNIRSPVVMGDAGGVMWFVNQNNSSIAAISSGTATSGQGAATAGTSISPSAGFGRDASIGIPFWIVPDGSGNLWVSDEDKGNIVLFFGLAAPTATPQLALPIAP